MSEELKHIDDYFRNSLINVEKQPPIDVWSIIEEDLDKDSKNKTRILFYRIAASVALIVTIGSGYLFYRNQNNKIPIESKNISENITITNSKTQKNVLSDITERKIPVLRKDEEYSEKIDVEEHKKSLFLANTALPPENREIISIKAISPKNCILATNRQNNKIKLTDQYIASEINRYNNIFENEQAADYNKNIVWALGGQFSPIIAKNDINIKENVNKLLDYSSSEKDLFAYAGGLSVNLETSKRFSIQSGIYYSRNGKQINNIGIYETTSFTSVSALDNYRNSGIINTSSGQLITEPGTNYYTDNRNDNTGSIDWESELNEYTYVDNIVVPVNEALSIEDRINSIKENSGYTIQYEEVSESIYYSKPLNPSNNINNTFEYIEIPLIVKYRVIEQKIGIQVFSGLSTNLLINNQIYYFSSAEEKVDIPNASNFSRFNYSTIFGLGFEYPLISNFVLSFEPSFKYFINPINNDNLTNSHPYSFAFYSGISYKF